MDKLDWLFENSGAGAAVTRAHFKKILRPWKCKEMTIDGRMVGVVMTKGHHLHMQLNKADALAHARRIIKQYLAPELNKQGFLQTEAVDGDGNTAFLRRLGFRPVHQRDGVTFYRLDRINIF